MLEICIPNRVIHEVIIVEYLYQRDDIKIRIKDMHCI